MLQLFAAWYRVRVVWQWQETESDRLAVSPSKCSVPRKKPIVRLFSWKICVHRYSPRLASSQSISGLGDRLDQLESVVGSVHTLVQRLDPTTFQSSRVGQDMECARSPPDSASRRHTPFLTLPDIATTNDITRLDWPATEVIDPIPQLLPVLARLTDISHSHVILRGPDDSERCFGPTSLWWLTYNFGELLREFVCQAGWNDSNEHGLAQEGFSQADEKMRQLLHREESTSLKPRDESSLTSPPHVILEALIDPYFDTINPYFPIWTRKRFQHLVQKSKQGLDGAHKRGFAVCANNLVILTLTAKVLHSRARNQQTAATSQSSCTDSDLLKTFVRNAHRALANVEQLLRPTLINLQALLSLVRFPPSVCQPCTEDP